MTNVEGIDSNSVIGEMMRMIKMTVA